MDKELIAQRLILLRGNRTKEEVALQLNISIRALESYETGQRTPRDSVKLALAKCYHSTVEAIFFQERCREA
jgi:DNA-binding XRE family transcriptional regulator